MKPVLYISGPFHDPDPLHGIEQNILKASPAARERFPFGVECKAQERIALPEWWQQCTRNAAAEGLTPLLVFRRNREDALAVLRWEDLLALLSEVQNLHEARGCRI